MGDFQYRQAANGAEGLVNDAVLATVRNGGVAVPLQAYAALVRRRLLAGERLRRCAQTHNMVSQRHRAPAKMQHTRTCAHTAFPRALCRSHLQVGGVVGADADRPRQSHGLGGDEPGPQFGVLLQLLGRSVFVCLPAITATKGGSELRWRQRCYNRWIKIASPQGQ